MQDFVEAALVIDWVSRCIDERCMDVYECGNRVFIDDLTHYYRAFVGIHRVHRDDTDVRGINIARAPLRAGRVPSDQIPSQVVHRNNLSGLIRWRSFVPDHLPLPAGTRQVEIAHILDWTDGSCPVEVRAHLGIGIGGVQRTNVETLET